MIRPSGGRWAAGLAIAGATIALISAVAMVAAGYLLDEQRIPPISLVPLFVSLGIGVLTSMVGVVLLVVAVIRR
ncbi:MAG: hypothetical protein EPO52_15110 [Herbiconiux sp.]|uniref:hypothetical protein n=1 Tax=Herbiconiux sp. TaxID=1871186 RepID=UPI0012143AB8|nr:hypothetical protein [Herbiconiux sp.]TAJ46861.1 MAG: hypothetical protein EPO52_15110 [Herbiconiux sp.]